MVVSRSAAWSRVRPALLERPQAFADVRSEGAISLPVGRRSKCDQDDVLEFDVIANSMVVAFCDAWRLRLRFAWQAQYFRSISKLAGRFFCGRPRIK